MDCNVCDARRSFPTVSLYVDSREVESVAQKQRMQPKAVEGRSEIWALGRVIMLR